MVRFDGSGRVIYQPDGSNASWGVLRNFLNPSTLRINDGQWLSHLSEGGIAALRRGVVLELPLT